MRRVVGLAAVVLLVAVAAPAASATGHSVRATQAGGADDGVNRFRFTRLSSQRSDLTFVSPSLPFTVRLRAGSGTIGDECTINFGGIPKGAYDVTTHYTDLEGQIAGYAWELSEHQCYDGTFRTDLLIHSEMSADGGQDDTWEPNAWTDADPDDYTSFGCIKVSYRDVLALEQAYEQAEAGGYPTELLVE